MLESLRKRYQNISFLDVILWVFRTAVIVAVIWGTVATILNNRYSAEQWIDFVMFGITQGSLYALIAMGYTLVYGVLSMINFAHSEFFMSGIFTATVFVAIPMNESGFMDNHPFWALLIIAIVAMATSMAIGILTERVAYRPLRRAPRLVPLITAIGASFFWQYFFRGLYGSGVTAFPTVKALEGKSWSLGPVEITAVQLTVIVVSVLLLVGLYIFVMRTKMGKAMRAVSEDKDIAALMGVNVDQVIVTTFAVGSALAGAAGVLYALMYRQVNFFMGFFPGLKAFTAAVLGGIGSVPGAAVGGLVLGLFESVGPNLFLEGLGIAAPYQLKDVIAFTMLVLVLMFRPQGIMGEPLAEEKA